MNAALSAWGAGSGRHHPLRAPKPTATAHTAIRTIATSAMRSIRPMMPRCGLLSRLGFLADTSQHLFRVGAGLARVEAHAGRRFGELDGRLHGTPLAFGLVRQHLEEADGLQMRIVQHA